MSGIGSESGNPWIERETGTETEIVIVIESGIFIVGDNLNGQWLYFFSVASPARPGVTWNG